MDVAIGKSVLIVVCSAAAIAAFTDVRSFKVYNLLTFPVLTSGLVYHAWTGGWVGVTTSVTGIVAGFAIMLVPYLVGGLGAGDAKFMMSLGAWLGAWPLVPVFVIGTVVMVVYAIVQAAFTHNLGGLWWNLQVSYLRIISMGRILAVDDSREDFHDWIDRKDRHKRLIPFSAMLAVGLVVTLVFGHVTFK